VGSGKRPPCAFGASPQMLRIYGDEFGKFVGDLLEEDDVGDVDMPCRSAGGAAAPDETIVAAGSVALTPEGGSAGAAFEQGGELVVGASAVVAPTAFEFEVDELVGRPIPEGYVPACALLDLVGGDGAVSFFAVGERVEDDAGDTEADGACVKGVAEDITHGLGVPNVPTRGRDVVLFEIVDKLTGGVPGKEEVFDLDDMGGEQGIGFWDSLAVVLGIIRLAISEGEGGSGESEVGDAFGHVFEPFAAGAGDLEGGGHLAHGEHHKDVIGFVDVVLVGGDGFDGEVEKVELGVILGKAAEDLDEEGAEAVCFCGNEDIELPGTGSLDHISQGDDLAFGIPEVDVVFAGLSFDDEGSGSFDPAEFGGGGERLFELVLDGVFAGFELLPGGDSGVAGEAEVLSH